METMNLELRNNVKYEYDLGQGSRTVIMDEELGVGAIYSDLWNFFLAGQFDENQDRMGWSMQLYGIDTKWEMGHFGHYDKHIGKTFGMFHWKSGARFFGEYNSKEYYQEPCGWGVMLCADGRKYIGQFKPDKSLGIKGYDTVPTGQGTWYDKDDNIIYPEEPRGWIRDGSKEIWPDGTIYDGQWKDGFYHGVGRLDIQGVGDLVYDGEFEKGVYQGFGRMYYDSGHYLECTWIDNKAIGEGIITGRNFYYEGGIKNQRFHGKGTLTYKGEVLDGWFLAVRFNKSTQGFGGLGTRFFKEKPENYEEI